MISNNMGCINSKKLDREDKPRTINVQPKMKNNDEVRLYYSIYGNSQPVHTNCDNICKSF